MKALILAAGRGTRLAPLTDDKPKPMLPIAGTPMIERILTNIASQTPIREFVLITGYKAEAVESYFGDGSKWGWSMSYVAQPVPRGVGDAVNCGKAEVGNSPFLMTYGDIMLDPSNYGSIFAKFQEEVADPRPKAIVGLNWVEDPWAGAAVYLNADGAIERIQEKPPIGTATTHWNNAGLFIFDPMIFGYTSRIMPSARGEFELPDAVTAMINAGELVTGFELQGKWRDVGTHDDYNAINKEFEVVPT